MKSFTLEILTQEKHLLTETVHSLTAMTSTGEVTILADHIPLFTRLDAGELSYTKNSQKTFFAISGGFLDVNPRNIVTVMAESALRSDQMDLQQINQAIDNAKKALKSAKDTKTSLKIELELRQALLQAKVARKHQKTRA